MPREFRTFWWNKHPNLGDALTPLLLESFGYQIVRAEPEDADLCVIGSILELIGPNFGGVILGAGFVQDGPPLLFPNAKVMALRGPLSSARARATGDLPLGDPALLTSRLLSERPHKQARVGIVPHYRDKGNEATASVTARGDGDVRIIDIQGAPLDVIRAIAECEVVLSSSLHGLVVADALGIPNCWLSLSDYVIGEGFKFRDYNLAINAVQSPRSLSGLKSVDELVSFSMRKNFDLRAKQAQLAKLFQSLAL